MDIFLAQNHPSSKLLCEVDFFVGELLCEVDSFGWTYASDGHPLGLTIPWGGLLRWIDFSLSVRFPGVDLSGGELPRCDFLREVAFFTRWTSHWAYFSLEWTSP